MSNFELQYTELGGIRSRMQSTGGNLANCAVRLRNQMNALGGQYGFGISSVRSSIGLSASAVSTLSNNSYAIAAFLSDLQQNVSDNESKAYSALAGAVPVEKKLTDALVAWTPSIIKIPWWTVLVPIFPITFFPIAIDTVVGWVSDYLKPSTPATSPQTPTPAPTSTSPAPASSGQTQGGTSGNNAATSTVNMGELEAFKNYCLDSKNWTDRPGGAKGGIDVDGAYGEQCADISKLWYMRMYGVASVGLSAWNNAGTAPMVNFSAKSNMRDVSGGPYAAGDSPSSRHPRDIPL